MAFVIIFFLRKFVGIQLFASSSAFLYCTLGSLLFFHNFWSEHAVLPSFSSLWAMVKHFTWLWDLVSFNHSLKFFSYLFPPPLFAASSGRYVITSGLHIANDSSSRLSALSITWSLHLTLTPTRPLSLAGLPFRTRPLLKSSLSLLCTFSAFIELLFFVSHPYIDYLEPALAAILLDSITSDVQPLAISSAKASSYVLINNLPFPSDLHDRDRFPGWKQRR